jgi:hypothetical protein
MTSIDDILSQVTSGYAETAISADIQDNKITGTFVGYDGGVFDYELTPDYIEYGESHLDSEYVNDYFTGILDASGVEYHGDSAYDYWKGFVGVELKKDAKVVTCKKGGVPCRGRCLPQGQKCRINQPKGSGNELGADRKFFGGVAAAGLLALGASNLMGNKTERKQEPDANDPAVEQLRNRTRRAGERIINRSKNLSTAEANKRNQGRSATEKKIVKKK